MNRQSMYSYDWFKYAYAPYNFFSRYNDTIDRDCYFLVEFYFLVDFLKKKLPLDIVQFIFTIVKEKQEQSRALHVANSNYCSYARLKIHVDNSNYCSNYIISSSPTYINNDRDFINDKYSEYLPIFDSDKVNKAKLSEALFGHSSLPKKNKKQWVQEKKEKPPKSKNRALKK